MTRDPGSHCDRPGPVKCRAPPLYLGVPAAVTVLFLLRASHKDSGNRHCRASLFEADDRFPDEPDRLERLVLPGLVAQSLLPSQAGVRAASGRTKRWPSHLILAGVLLVAALVAAPPDRRSPHVVGASGLPAGSWYIRSVTAGAGR